MTPGRVAVVGAGGRMGAEVCRAVAAAPDLELVAAVDPARAGEPLAAVADVADGDLTVAGDLAAVTASDAGVLVDFTVAGAARRTLAWCAEHHLDAVVGTTGLDADDLDDLRRRFPDDGPAGCVVAPNFAIGAILMMRFAELAAPWFETAEIVELHHEAQRDAPPGTALLTAARMGAARMGAAGAGAWAGDPTTNVVVDGARGGVAPGGVRVHSVRLRGLVAHQEVLLGTTGEGLTIRHDSYQRTSFMPGVLLAIRAVPTRPGLTVGLDALLGI